MIYPGLIIATLRSALKAQGNERLADEVQLSDHQLNGAFGVHQLKAKVKDDPTVYRIIVAPADAPITINGRPIGDHFALPIGDA